MQDHKRIDPTVARFFFHAKENPAKSRQEGRPVFDQIEYVEITIPGDSRTRLVRAVTDVDRRRWPDLYARFKEAGEAQPVEGTPLEQWPQITVSQIAEMKAQHVYTVEQLANVADHLLHRLGLGARALQTKAREWLALGEDKGRAVEKILQQGEELSAALRRISDLEGQVRELASECAIHKATAEQATAALEHYAALLQQHGIPIGGIPQVTVPAVSADPDGVLQGVDMNAVVPAPKRGRRAA